MNTQHWIQELESASAHLRLAKSIITRYGEYSQDPEMVKAAVDMIDAVIDNEAQQPVVAVSDLIEDLYTQEDEKISLLDRDLHREIQSLYGYCL